MFYHLKICCVRILRFLNHQIWVHLGGNTVLGCPKTIPGRGTWTCRVKALTVSSMVGAVGRWHESLAQKRLRRSETGRNQAVENLGCKAKGLELFLKAMKTLSSKWSAFRMSLPGACRADWMGTSMAAATRVTNAAVLFWACHECLH